MKLGIRHIVLISVSVGFVACTLGHGIDIPVVDSDLDGGSSDVSGDDGFPSGSGGASSSGDQDCCGGSGPGGEGGSESADLGGGGAFDGTAGSLDPGGR